VAANQTFRMDKREHTLLPLRALYSHGIGIVIVIIAQTTLLTDQQTAVNFRMQEMVASAQLIKALGGGWDVAQIPTTKEIRAPIGSN
jgi:outer membrane protein TolC